jgi:hypothetical protein
MRTLLLLLLVERMELMEFSAALPCFFPDITRRNVNQPNMSFPGPAPKQTTFRTFINVVQCVPLFSWINRSERYTNNARFVNFKLA